MQLLCCKKLPTRPSAAAPGAIPAVATGEANGAPGGGVTAADLAEQALLSQGPKKGKGLRGLQTVRAEIKQNQVMKLNYRIHFLPAFRARNPKSGSPKKKLLKKV